MSSILWNMTKQGGPLWNPEAVTRGVPLKKALLKILAIFTGKLLCWSLFQVKSHVFRSVTLLKIDSNTGLFLFNTNDSFFQSLVLQGFKKYYKHQRFFGTTKTLTFFWNNEVLHSNVISGKSGKINCVYVP